ncbi:MAG: amidohydrolase family protein [Acidobacteriia bacterium]|nr:amidohydrolase family protein [Terriglobia bacterium]
MIRTVHTAKYVLAEAGMLLRNAAVHVSDPGRISRLEPWQSPPPNLETRVVNWGSAIILPGLVNAHSHLELTRMRKLADRSTSFTGWLSAVMTGRQEWTKEDYLESTRKGAQLSLASGTTLAGDISASGFSWEALKPEKLRKVVFEEVTALQPERAHEAISRLQARLERVETDGYLSSSASAHALYSVSPDLFRAVAELVRDRGSRFAAHVAETMQEVEFLRSGMGEFVEFLSGLGVLPERWSPPGLAPVPYLEELGVLERPAILIHCNYLDEDSMARILSRSCSVVYCPRSHAFFGHEPHPVRRLLDMGINVALGTDSLASTDSLSILDEMRFLFRNRKDLKCDEIIRMATLNGAVALDFGGVLGRLRRGYWADMTVLRLPDGLSDRNVTAQILEGAGECLATIVQGEIVWTKVPILKKMTSDEWRTKIE